MANTRLTIGLLDHSTDANFRLWGLEVNAGLAAVGLTQTSDTGQINWSTVTRSAVGVAAGYEIWQFTDSLQSTAPIVFKLEYGTGGAATTQPAAWITIGTGSNGSGTINNILTARQICTAASAPISATTNYISKFVFNPTYGFFGIVFKEKGMAPSGITDLINFRISRSVDQTTGLPTGIGYNFMMTNSNANGTAPVSNSATFSTGFVSGNISSGYYVLPGNSASTLLNGTPGTAQVFRPKFIYPQELAVSQWGLCLSAELPLNSQFSARLIGTTSLNYVVNYAGGYIMTSVGTSGLVYDFMLWQ